MQQNLFKSECHIFEVDGRRVLFDVLRGGFFEIDDVTHDVLDACDGQGLEEIVSGLSERHSPDEVEAVIEELGQAEIVAGEPLKVAPFHPPSRIEISHLSLCVTRDNVEAPLPSPVAKGYASVTPSLSPHVGGREGDRGLGEGVLTPLYMSEAVALGAIDFLLRESGALRDCEVTFEGNPLLNVPLLRRIIEYGEERAGALGKRIAFEVVTDGALLTRRVADYFAEKGVAIVLEIGPEDDPEGVERVASLFEASCPPATLHLRVVASGRSLNLAGRIEALARRLPFAASIGVRWANLPAGHPDALRAEDLPEVRSTLRALSGQTLGHLLRRGETFLEEIEGAMAQLLERQVLFYSCGAGTRSLTVSPEGGLFPCFDLVGWGPLRMGDIFFGADADLRRGWLRDLHVERRAPCRGCWARYLCGGGCRADAVLTTGDAAVPNRVSCERIRHTYECAMAVCLEVEERAPGLLSSRYLTAPVPSPEVESGTQELRENLSLLPDFLSSKFSLRTRGGPG